MSELDNLFGEKGMQLIEVGSFPKTKALLLRYILEMGLISGGVSFAEN